MEFKEFKELQQKHVAGMLKDITKLFVVGVDKEVLWETYLDSFPEGTNPIYRERREFDCGCCSQFIKSFGNVVTIKDNKVITIWDFETGDSTYQPVANALSKFIKLHPVTDVFVTRNNIFGTDKNYEDSDKGVITWEHFYVKIPASYIVNNKADSIESIQGNLRDNRSVFKRSMEELTLNAANIILELITQDSLYRGAEHKAAITSFITYKKEYDKLSDQEKENWCWTKSFNNPIVRIRNTALGTLLIDLSADMDVDVAVKKFESVMAPTNYKRPTAIITKRMIEEAEAKLEELGLTNSIHRRFAELEDITVNNVLFVNRDAKKKLKGSVFDEMKNEVTLSPKKFDKVEEVHIVDFMKNILPTSTNIELMLENRHNGNLISLISPAEKDTPSMFKWSNNFSWAYNGNITDSMRERVVSAGGRVDGVFRFTHSWNELERNESLMDLHVFLPAHGAHKEGYHNEYRNAERVGWNNRNHNRTKGIQDVDYTSQAPVGYIPIENITFPDLKLMPEGKYVCKIHNWAFRNSGGRGKAEIEFEGNIYQYEYPATRNKEWVTVAEVTLKDGRFSIEHKLPESCSTRTIWGLKTNQFAKVNVAMFSPNYWDGQESNGNKHYFFFMDNCKNEGTPRGFFNEFLNENLTKHRKVFEVLGSKMKVDESDKQLSGLGFSSTQRNSIVAKVDGAISRMIKIIF